MAKLLDDPKVAELVSKECARAVKVESKRILDIVKACGEVNKEEEDKPVKKAVAAVLKEMVAQIKGT